MEKKSLFKKLMLIAVMAFFATFFVACGGTLTTTVTMNSSQIGTRVMTYEILKEDFDYYVNAPISKVDKAIADNCPEELEYTFSETEDKYIATFTMEFSTLVQYENKMNSFCGREFKAELYETESVFKDTVMYKESLDPTLTMNWFADTLIENGFLYESDINYLYERSTMSMFYNDELVGTSDQEMDFTLSKYVNIDKINVATKANVNGTYDRTITVDFQSAQYNKKPDEIETFLQEACAKGVSFNHETESSHDIFTISRNGMNDAEMELMMNTFFHSADCSFDTVEPEKAGDYLMSVDCDFEEIWYPSVYDQCNEDGEVPLFLEIENEDLNDIRVWTKGVEGKYENQHLAMTKSDEEDAGYRYDITGYIYATEKVVVHMNKDLHCKEVNYITDVSNTGKITKNIEFVLDNAEDTEVAIAAKKIRDACDECSLEGELKGVSEAAIDGTNTGGIVITDTESTESVSEETTQGKPEDGNGQSAVTNLLENPEEAIKQLSGKIDVIVDGRAIILNVEGSDDEVTEIMAMLTQASTKDNRSAFGKGTNWPLPTDTYLYRESICFGKLLHTGNEDEIKATVNYTVKTPGIISDINGTDEKFTTAGTRSTALLYYNTLPKKFSVVSYGINWITAGSFILLLIALGAAVFSVLKFINYRKEVYRNNTSSISIDVMADDKKE